MTEKPVLLQTQAVGGIRIPDLLDLLGNQCLTLLAVDKKTPFYTGQLRKNYVVEAFIFHNKELF
jgi:hypothetical protein